MRAMGDAQSMAVLIWRSCASPRLCFRKRITEQPSQISFELALGVALLKHTQRGFRSLVLEDEGRLSALRPTPLVTKRKKDANWIHLEASLTDRVQHSYENYILSNLEELLCEGRDNAFDSSPLICSTHWLASVNGLVALDMPT